MSEKIEETQTVEETQVDAGKESNSQDINWVKANATMSEQANQVKALSKEIEQLKEAKNGSFSGRDDEDLITVKDLKDSFAEKDKSYQNEIAELRVQAQHPDYSEVLDKYGKTLPKEALETIKYSPDPYKFAYILCKQSPAYIKDQMSGKTFKDAEKIDENLKKPGNPAKAGSSGLLSNISKYSNMSGEEILALNAKFRK